MTVINSMKNKIMHLSKYPFIYVDLDETLISTVVRKEASSGEKRFNFKLGGYWYCTMLRPSAQSFIKYCNSLSLTRLLTNSVRDYATAVVDHFDFGFTSEEMICRDDYIRYEPDGWRVYGGSSREIAVVKDSLNRHRSILVDNLYPDDPSAIHKMKFLGIDESRYIQIRDFNGSDPDKFESELDDIKEKLAALVQGQE